MFVDWYVNCIIWIANNEYVTDKGDGYGGGKIDWYIRFLIY